VTAYVLAADGGNSKTDVVVASLAGAVLGRAQVAGTCPHLHGLPATVQVLVDGVAAARAAAGLAAADAIVAADFCLANADLEEEEQAFAEALSAAGVAERVAVHNDTYAVLQAGAPEGWGVAVVCGAGINAFGRAPDGRTHRFLALGWETGDWGGGEGLAKEALGAAVRAGDGRGPDTVLRRLVAEALDRGDVEAAAVDVHRGLIDGPTLRSIAPVVFTAAAGGDSVARAIVERLADELLGWVAAAVRRLGLADAAVPVVLGGAVLQARHPLLVDRFRVGLASIAPLATVTVLDVAPVAGALAGALRAAGAEESALVRARGGLAS
jgi:N-acetylglucosamine kinase-like BadF-type ATPase